MATSRSEIPIVKLINSEETTIAVDGHGNPTWDSMVSSKGHYIKTSGVDCSKLFLEVKRSSLSTDFGQIWLRGTTGKTSATTGIALPAVTDTYVYTGRGKGDKSFSIASSTGVNRNIFFIGPLESARYKTPINEYIMVDGTSEMSTQAAANKGSFIRAILLP